LQLLDFVTNNYKEMDYQMFTVYKTSEVWKWAKTL
jgi:hypothetical protein